MRVLILLAALSALSPGQIGTPRLATGEVPAPPVVALGGGEVILEVAVDEEGRSNEVRVLRDTPPFTRVLRDAVLGWMFEPGAPGTVMVAGLFASPTLYAPAPGEPPRDVGSPSASIPFPATIAPAPYPPTAAGGNATVLVEVHVDAQGVVSSAAVIRSAPGFDSSALDAARRWRFRPARRGGAAAASVAYLAYGFRQPVLAPPRRP